MNGHIHAGHIHDVTGPYYRTAAGEWKTAYRGTVEHARGVFAVTVACSCGRTLTRDWTRLDCAYSYLDACLDMARKCSGDISEHSPA